MTPTRIVQIAKSFIPDKYAALVSTTRNYPHYRTLKLTAPSQRSRWHLPYPYFQIDKVYTEPLSRQLTFEIVN